MITSITVLWLKLLVSAMQSKGPLGFIDISITYMNYSGFSHIGKQSTHRGSDKTGTNLEHIIDFAEVQRISMYQ